MHQTVGGLVQALEKLSLAFGTNNESSQLYTETHGWQGPAVSRHDLAQLAKILANDLKITSNDGLSETFLKRLQSQDWPRRLALLQQHTLPQIIGAAAGSAAGPRAIAAYVTTLIFLRQSLSPDLLKGDSTPPSWEEIKEKKLLPAKLAKRLEFFEAQLQSFEESTGDLNERINRILEADEAAESLPITLNSLREARDAVQSLKDESGLSRARIDEIKAHVETSLSEIEAHKLEAVQYIEKCETAYGVTTSKGLAGAFETRATSLARSVWIWMALLTVGLVCAIVLGYLRSKSLASIDSGKEPLKIWIEVVISIFGVGAPIWFSWVATRQISQRFRLSEDYAYKASVAKAYEGYRREAAKIDPRFEAALFGSALSRLDELPLRLLDKEDHGTPAEAALSKANIGEAINKVIHLKNETTQTLEQGIEALKSVVGK